MRWFLLPTLCLCFFTLSCTRQKLSVQSEYLTVDRYASVYVQTPDPRKYFPSLGQRLIIQWRLKHEMELYSRFSIKMRILFRNYETFEKEIPICRPLGRFAYNIMDEDYECTGGILAYDVYLLGDGQVIDQVKHHIWQELVTVPFEGDDAFDQIDFSYDPEGSVDEEYFNIEEW